jgi:hypothetical protein
MKWGPFQRVDRAGCLPLFQCSKVEKTGQEFQPASGDELERLIERVVSAAREAVEQTQGILRAK